VPSDLWLMQADGSNERLVSDAGFSCADPAFSPDGTQIAFSVDETGVGPVQRSIWIAPASFEPPEPPEPSATPEPTVSTTVPLTGTTTPLTGTTTPLTGTTTPLTGTVEPITDTEVITAAMTRLIAGDGEWNRTNPQWLDDNRLVYNASAPDGRSTLFLRRLPEDMERDIGAEIVVGNVGDGYRTLEHLLVSPDGRVIAIEAVRDDDDGADLLLLDKNGAQQEQIGNGYWTRPLAWSSDGELLYITTACPGTLVQDYALYLRDRNGNEQLLMAGNTLSTLGDVAMVGSDGGIAYVMAEFARPGARGTSDVVIRSNSDLWYWNRRGNRRSILYSAERAIIDVDSSNSQ
jgi:hypothetical protein